MIDKKRVRQGFQRAAATYDTQAVIQQRVADHLLALLGGHHTNPIHRVLEIGCCTGLLTRKLCAQYSDINELVLNDLVEDFAAIAGNQPGIPAVRFLAGDIEETPLPGSFDLIISSSTFHWVNNLPALLAKLAHHLAPNGLLAFSMYGQDNMHEIRTLCGVGLKYYSASEIADIAARYCRIAQSDEQHQVFSFDSAQSVLEHLRQTGVNSLNTVPWTKKRLQQFYRAYERQFQGSEGVQLTYHPMYIIARKKAQ